MICILSGWHLFPFFFPGPMNRCRVEGAGSGKRGEREE